MFPGVESGGSVRYQIGQSLNAIRAAVDAEDPLSLANHCRLLVALASPYLEDQEIHRISNSEDEGEIWESCMTLIEQVLPILSSKGLYAYVSADFKDGKSLALTDEEPSLPPE
jgi:hypothetical protein